MFKISVKKERFVEILTIANEITSKQTTPLLSNVYLHVANLILTVKATDSSIGFEAALDIENGDDGTLLIPCDKLLNAVKALNDDVRIEQIDGSIVRIHSPAQNNIEYTLYFTKESLYPEFAFAPQDGYSLFPQKALKNLIVKTEFAVSHDESRLNISGVFFNAEEKTLTLVGTDGRRLSCVEVTTDIDTSVLKLEKGIVIPLRILLLIEKYSGEGEVGLQLVNNKILFIKLYDY